MVERIRRTEMASPGSSVRMMRKALEELPADEVFLDLEDAVAPNMKEQARENVVNILNEAHPPKWKTVAVRINSLATKHWIDDIKFVVEGAGDKIDCIIIPKVNTAHEIKTVENMLEKLEEKLGLEKKIGIEAQIETAMGMVNVNEIAFSSSRLEALIFGPGDYAASLGIPSLTIGSMISGYEGHIWHYAMFQIRNAAAAAGLQAIDGPYAVIDDLDGLEKSAITARSLGFDGKWVIHPKQIEICNRVFSPSEAEINKARLIISEYQRAWSEGRGAISLEGELVDAATIRMAEKILSLAEKIKLRKTNLGQG